MSKKQVNLGTAIIKTAKKSIKTAGKAVNKTIQDIKDIDIKEIGNDIEEKVNNVLKKKEEAQTNQNKCINGKGAAIILYYLMAADGEIYHNEKDKYDDICKELYSEYENDENEITAICQKQLEQVIDTDDFYDVMTEGVAYAVAQSWEDKKANIPPKLFLWDLLTVAYSDEKYSSSERKLIKYISRKLEVDKTIFLEMESSIKTLMALDEEEEWLKTTDRQYLEIEAELNEIEDRRNTIIKSVQDLITM